MTVDEDWDTTGGAPAALDGEFGLGRAVASLYADLRLTPTLHRLLAHSRRVVGGVAGSISVVDARAGTYSKVAERGISCRLGHTFSLDDGATGHAVAHRGPVVIDDYSALTSRHLPPEHAANRGSVVAVPLWWRGDLIGVNVAFAGRRRRFSAGEIDLLDVLTQTAAGAIVTAGAKEPSLARLAGARARAADGAPGRGVVVRTPDPRAALAAPGGVVAARRDDAGGAEDADAGPRALLTRTAGGRTSPLTRREAQVLALAARGLGDREIARELVLSPRTVEKHVGSSIRKTGTSSRTGAAVHALGNGWI